MATNKVQDGNVLTYTNGNVADISSGDLIEIGDRVAVALVDIPKLGTGEIAVTGVFSYAAENDTAWSLGDALYYDGTKLTKDDDTGANVAAGYAAAPKAQAAAVGLVKLNG